MVERAIGAHRRGGAHPATRTFQALRIAVNHEMESLATLLRDGPAMLNPGGRMLVIAYHSLEDRPVKERFRELARGGRLHGDCAQGDQAVAAETSRNPRARSAQSSLYRTERTMSARVRPTRRPSKIVPAVLAR